MNNLKVTRKKKRGKNFDLKEEYKNSWNYIKESKKFIYAIIAIFFVFVLIGFFIPTSDSLEKQILKFIKELIEQTQGMSKGELIKFIFFNNLQSSFFGMIFGVLLGIFPVIAAISNGYLLGFVSSMSVENGGLLVLWKLLPHGIFELPAIFISLGLGLKFGSNFIRNIYNSYFVKIIPSFLLFILLCFLFLPLTLFSISLFFIFFIYKDYISHYYNKKKYFFLVISILFPFVFFFNIIFNENLQTIWNKDYSNSLKVFFLIVIPLLVIAGIIEGSLMFIIG